MNLNRIFHYKPSILGAHPYFWKHPYAYVLYILYIHTYDKEVFESTIWASAQGFMNIRPGTCGTNSRRQSMSEFCVLMSCKCHVFDRIWYMVCLPPYACCSFLGFICIYIYVYTVDFLRPTPFICELFTVFVAPVYMFAPYYVHSDFPAILGLWPKVILIHPESCLKIGWWATGSLLGEWSYGSQLILSEGWPGFKGMSRLMNVKP